MFYFAEVDPLTLADAEIELLDVGILAQLAGSAVEHHATIFKNIAMVGITQRNIGVLLGQQEGNSLILVETGDILEYLFHQLRGQAHRWFV